MNRLFTIIYITLCAHLVTVAANDPFKTAKAALKSGANLEQAEKALTDYAATREATHANRARAYNMAAQVAMRINMAENEKLYLKQKFDTIRFFSSILRLYQHVERCDSVERELDEQGRVRQNFTKANRKMRSRHRRNLVQGGKWMMAHQRWADAYDYFNTYCTADSDALQSDTMRVRISYWASKCAYAAGNMPAMLHYVDTALTLHQDEAYLLECKSHAQIAVGDSAGWLQTLEQGLHSFPRHIYFFAQHNYYLRLNKRFDEALVWTKRLYEEIPDSIIFLYGTALTYFEGGNLDSCIVTCEQVLGIEPEHSEAQLYLGASWVNKALRFAEHACYDTRDPQCREDRRRLMAMYRSALLPLQSYRRLRPDDKRNWAPLLYKVYYALNMGDELAEIEAAMTN